VLYQKHSLAGLLLFFSDFGITAASLKAGNPIQIYSGSSENDDSLFYAFYSVAKSQVNCPAFLKRESTVL
jgi:hypothetical protein